jgi:hypothetical protein
VLVTVACRRLTAASAGTSVTPVAHDTNSTALDANTTSATGATVTATSIFRHIVMSNDEPAVSSATMDEWEMLVPNGTIWDASYGDSIVEPIFCRAGFGWDIEQTTASAVGACDAEILFTNN